MSEEDIYRVKVVVECTARSWRASSKLNYSNTDYSPTQMTPPAYIVRRSSHYDRVERSTVWPSSARAGLLA
jgi:hypothetical protein